jgi:hypothetical protein
MVRLARAIADVLGLQFPSGFRKNTFEKHSKDDG